MIIVREAAIKFAGSFEPRAVLVIDEKYNLMGILTLKDIIRGLGRVVLPLYYGRPEAYAKVMRSAIALDGSFFNTQRMVSQYVTNAYFSSNIE